MRFPQTPRISYGRNPLVEVLCQLRFPKILRIEAEPPVDLQEAVRTHYPILNPVQSVEFALPMRPHGKPTSIAVNRGQSYEFVTTDGQWKLVLAADFITLFTSKYTRWEEFRRRLLEFVEALVKIYSPVHFSRVGLRYKDLIVRSKLGLQEKNWSQLLKPHIAGALVAENVSESDVRELHSVFALALDEGTAAVRVQHGLAREVDQPEVGYLIDIDFYTETPTEIKNVGGTVDIFNREAGRLFRWCITEELHQAMVPELVGTAPTEG